MGIFRTETNISTGEIVVIHQLAYQDDIGNIIVLDEGVSPPAGYSITSSLPEPAKVVPDRVTMRQARLALLGAGLLDEVETALAALDGTTGQAARIEWEYSQEVWRNKPFVSMIGQALDLSSAEMDTLFIQAAAL